jgi:hypothetical protein
MRAIGMHGMKKSAGMHKTPSIGMPKPTSMR